MYGRVTKYFHDRGFGFIRGEDGNSYFIHASKLYGEYLDRDIMYFLNHIRMKKVIIMQKM